MSKLSIITRGEDVSLYWLKQRGLSAQCCFLNLQLRTLFEDILHINASACPLSFLRPCLYNNLMPAFPNSKPSSWRAECNFPHT